MFQLYIYLLCFFFSFLDAPTTAPGWQKPLLATGATDRRTPLTMKTKDPKAKQVHSSDVNKGATLSKGDDRPICVSERKRKTRQKYNCIANGVM